jgi:hypothetical protein
MQLRPTLTGWLLVCTALCLGDAARAAAEPPLDQQPARYVGALSAGVPLRLGQSEKFGQGTFAPAFTDALGGYVFGGRARFRHGLGLGLSTNLSGDGGYTEPVYALDQMVVMPSYLLYWDANPDLFALGHAGLPILVRGGKSVGVEAGAALGYRLLAGFGAFAGAGFDVFAGTSSALHLTFSLEAGLFLDYEVLP